MIVAPEKIKDMTDSFRTVFSNKESAKALNSANTDIFNILADSMQVSPDDIKAAYNYWVKKTKKAAKKAKKNPKPEADAGVVSVLVEAIIPQ